MTPPALFSSRLFIPRGFRFAAARAGLKKGGGLDLGLVEVPGGATAAAVFTSNRVVAAPLEIGREHLARSRGRVRAVLVNSGNANCATRTGRAVCEKICRAAAARLGSPAREVFPSSTGVIGVELPGEKILAALPRLLAGRGNSRRAVRGFARAIMTTDTRPKLAAARFRCGEKRATLLGVAKGAGMISPQLALGKHATMLVYLFTDAAASPAALARVLRAACARSFNRISVDGDTSTNDTVLLLASGAAGARVARAADKRHFAAALEAVCRSLAQQIVADGEGVKHAVELRVEGARTEREAEKVARAIANSPLVKTAWAGADPNWGRILAAIGNAGVPLDPRRVEIFLAKQRVCRGGRAVPFNERRAHRALSRRQFMVRVRLGRGRAATTFWTCDLTADYVRVNAHYRS
jgi:glutamate N-acetyltransferase/amino-acid N-acetyltransferase